MQNCAGIRSILVDDDTIRPIIDSLMKEHGNFVDLSCLDVSRVTDFSSLFLERPLFNGNISNWDVSNGIDFSFMFFESSFNGKITEWEIPKAEDVEDMFASSKFEAYPPKWYRDL